MTTKQSKRVLAEIRAFTSDITAISLATVDAEGLPYATNIYVAPDQEMRFYFLSSPNASHIQHILRQPAVALTAYAPIRMWQRVRGIQMQGVCRPLPSDQFAEAWAIYVNKYPHINEVREHVQTLQFYRITPDTLRWIDNSRHFGFRVDLKFPLVEPISARADYSSLV